MDSILHYQACKHPLLLSMMQLLREVFAPRALCPGLCHRLDTHWLLSNGQSGTPSWPHTTVTTAGAHQPRLPSHNTVCCLMTGLPLAKAQIISAQVYSPNHMVSNSGPLTEMKLAWHSLAIALASSVFPQPAGVSNQSVQAHSTRERQSFHPTLRRQP